MHIRKQHLPLGIQFKTALILSWRPVIFSHQLSTIVLKCQFKIVSMDSLCLVRLSHGWIGTNEEEKKHYITAAIPHGLSPKAEGGFP